MDGRGGGDRKHYRSEFQGVRRNAGERQGTEKEQEGLQRNPYRPLKGPSFFSVLRFRRLCFFSLHKSRRRLRFKFRGTDGKPTTEPSQETGEAGPSEFLHCKRNFCRAAVRRRGRVISRSPRPISDAAVPVELHITQMMCPRDGQSLGNANGGGLQSGEIFAELGNVKPVFHERLDSSIDQLSALTHVEGVAFIVKHGDPSIHRDGKLKGTAVAILPIEIEPD